jgi:hypothetical protein
MATTKSSSKKKLAPVTPVTEKVITFETTRTTTLRNKSGLVEFCAGDGHDVSEVKGKMLVQHVRNGDGNVSGARFTIVSQHGSEMSIEINNMDVDEMINFWEEL